MMTTAKLFEYSWKGTIDSLLSPNCQNQQCFIVIYFSPGCDFSVSLFLPITYLHSQKVFLVGEPTIKIPETVKELLYIHNFLS